MLVDFSSSPVGIEHPPSIDTLRVIALVASCLDAALGDRNSLVHIICAHSAVPGEHSPGPDCWCCPEEFVFGLQPFFSIA